MSTAILERTSMAQETNEVAVLDTKTGEVVMDASPESQIDVDIEKFVSPEQEKRFRSMMELQKETSAEYRDQEKTIKMIKRSMCGAIQYCQAMKKDWTKGKNNEERQEIAEKLQNDFLTGFFHLLGVSAERVSLEHVLESVVILDDAASNGGNDFQVLKELTGHLIDHVARESV